MNNIDLRSRMKKTVEIPDALKDFDLPYKPSILMTQYQPKISVNTADDVATIAYLVDDAHLENPLDARDGMGQILRRDWFGQHSDGINAALGLDRYGEPELGIVRDSELLDVLIQRADVQGAEFDELFRYCKENFPKIDPQRSKADYVLECLRDVDDFEAAGVDLDSLRLELWKKGLEEGSIGNRYSMLLNVSEQPKICYSLPSQEIEYRIITSQNRAIWIADDEAISEIRKRVPAYLKGSISKHQNSYTLLVLDVLLGKQRFSTWNEAFQALDELEATPIRTIREAELEAIAEIVSSALVLWNAYCNREVYGIVVADFDAETMEFLDDEVAWGLYGSGYALEKMNNWRL
jgi:hypothetical protein